MSILLVHPWRQLRATLTKVVENTELKKKPTQIRTILASYLVLAATELKKNGKFKLGGKAMQGGLNPGGLCSRRGLASLYLISECACTLRGGGLPR